MSRRLFVVRPEVLNDLRNVIFKNKFVLGKFFSNIVTCILHFSYLKKMFLEFNYISFHNFKKNSSLKYKVLIGRV